MALSDDRRAWLVRGFVMGMGAVPPIFLAVLLALWAA